MTEPRFQSLIWQLNSKLTMSGSTWRKASTWRPHRPHRPHSYSHPPRRIAISPTKMTESSQKEYGFDTLNQMGSSENRVSHSFHVEVSYWGTSSYHPCYFRSVQNHPAIGVIDGTLQITREYHISYIIYHISYIIYHISYIIYPIINPIASHRLYHVGKK